jgi:hypothetical protein
VDILTRFKELFHYNANAARFIAGVSDSKEERGLVKQVEPVYVRLTQTNREFGNVMKEN